MNLIRRLAALSLSGLACSAGLAAATARIEQVTVYPGLAQVSRSAPVAAGARELVLDCLSPSFDMASLRVEADAGIRLGPVSARTRPRTEVAECSSSPLDARIRSLEDRLAALQAENGGHELALGYLRSMTAADAASAPRGNALPSNLQAALAAVQRAGQQSLADQHRIAREREALQRELAPLRSERDRLGLQTGQVRQLRISLSAAREGTLRLRYQVSGPTWAPAYRATLDAEAGLVEIERLAQVSQNSGEDWSGVALRLSTGSPRGSTAGPLPRPWQLSLQPPPPPPAPAPSMRARAFAPAAPKQQTLEQAEEAQDTFTVQVAEGEFATEFEVPGTVDVASGAQRVSLALGSARWPARVKLRSTPQLDASAWLVAELARPEGVWPEGPMQLQRGGQVVGSSVWRMGEQERITLPFGRDERVRVQVVPAQQHNGSAGFLGGRSEQQISRSYVVESRHTRPMLLEVLEAGPVSTNEQITVTRQFQPAVQPGAWQDQPGIVAWAMTLDPGASARFSAEYRISHPKELSVFQQR